jgi:hypothetical protein
MAIMKKLLSLFTLTMLILTAAPAVAFATKPASNGNTPEYVGYDIAWPQCGKKLPTGQSFGIIGINGGNAANTNPCLSSQLNWATKSVGGTAQAKLQLYVNTANPGEVISQITTWPTKSSPENPYPDACTGKNDMACSWQYGWNRALEDNRDRFTPAAKSMGLDPAAPRMWWLDVETMNTWQSGSSEALARNAATLEGMTSYFESIKGTVGLYSTAAQWATIAGTVSPTSNLNGLPNWRPSGASLNNAKANCSVPPLTAGGFISLTQYVEQNLDKNHSCI